MGIPSTIVQAFVYTFFTRRKSIRNGGSSGQSFRKILRMSKGLISKLSLFIDQKQQYFVIIALKKLKMKFKFKYTRLTKKVQLVLGNSYYYCRVGVRRHLEGPSETFGLQRRITKNKITTRGPYKFMSISSLLNCIEAFSDAIDTLVHKIFFRGSSQSPTLK